MRLLKPSELRVIEFDFQQLKRHFDIYNDFRTYSTEYRFEHHEKAEGYIERLKQFGLYYTIYDEDDELSYIRPDCYLDEYDDKYQRKIEKMLHLEYEKEEDDA